MCLSILLALSDEPAIRNQAMNADSTQDKFPSRPKHECGVCGIFGHEDAAKLTYFGLYALQHRGQESAGIVVSDGNQVKIHKNMGLVPEVFSEDILQKLTGNMTIGHVRYSTTGESNIVNTQPFMVNYKGTPLAIAHNGNLVNSIDLRNDLERKGSIFQTTMDSEIVLHLLARSLDLGLAKAVKESFGCIRGAYSLLLMTKDTMVAVRDPNGFRPLSLGRLENGAYIVASETCAFDLVQAEFIRDVEPGEVLIINKDGLESIFPWPTRQKSFCIFEQVYFARPDSDIFGINVYTARKRMGQILAREAKIDGDFIMPFPDSGNYAAIGYSHASGIPLEMGMIRNHYIGRTFIQPTQSMRDFSVRVKLNPVRSLLKDKKAIIVEDSIIRGTTGRSRVKSLRDAGAKEVHMLVSCPPTCHPCFYGIDFPSNKELIAGQKSVDGIRDYLGLDSLTYLSLDGLVEATGLERDSFCLACYTGVYPVAPDPNFQKHALSNGCACVR